MYITDDTYTKKQVLRMEHLILKVLAFELAVPTSHYFLQRYIQLTRSSETTLHLATVNWIGLSLLFFIIILLNSLAYFSFTS